MACEDDKVATSMIKLKVELHDGKGALLGIELISTNSHHVPSSVLIVEPFCLPFWVLRARPSRLSNFYKEKLFQVPVLEVTSRNLK